MNIRLDRVGILIGALMLYGATVAPFATARANRIVQGEAKGILEALPSPINTLLFAIILLIAVSAFFRTRSALRLLVAFAGLTGLCVSIGISASFLTPVDNTYARVSPASGFWVIFAALALLGTDAIARLDPKPAYRVLFLVMALMAIGLMIGSGQWNNLSLLKEYSSRADVFWVEALRHVQLAIGSLIAATVIGIPLGIICHRVNGLRSGVLNTLNIVQTIPSIALFGILIAPLGWIAINVPGASAIGIRGIGMAPAFVALFLYSLLPVVSNTVVGLAGVPQAANEAARGLGMTGWQRLTKVEFPLALPIILTGIRIVLVQNIGLATIAALIGGGGFGVFVFQGIGQTAMDLVLLGTIPTVIMGFAAAILLDALIYSNIFNRSGTTRT